MALVLNFVAFQIGWFSAVLSATWNQPRLGALVMAVVVLVHLVTVPRAGPELALVLLCGVIGGIWDSILVSMGWVAYPSGMVFQGAAPYWIVAMWMLFATTLNQSLRWLKGRPALAVLFGVAGGPLAYFTGEKLGGIQLVQMQEALLALAVGWGAMMPLLLLLATRFDGVTVHDDARQGWVLD
ncbi:MAG: DUF2878 domain-containing protein [Woeseia sp.]